MDSFRGSLTMAGRKTADALAWLRGNPSLAELKARYPDDWQAVSDDLGAIFAEGRPEALQAYLASLAAMPAATSVGRRPDQGRLEAEALVRQVRHRMAHLALRNSVLAAAAKGRTGKIRFNWLNGFIAQKLLFAHDLVRKPVSPFWFRLLWPLLWQRDLLMPLVEPKGIYCFYSKTLIAGLARLIGDRPCLEVASGDGTLSRFLAEAGVAVTATDDYSWKHAVDYPESVLKLDAGQALKRFRPKVVVCSWPPAGNGFERRILADHGVELYIVIGSRLEFATGNWADYRAQAGFELMEDGLLGSGVLPPELAGTVWLFRRRTA